MSDTAPNTLDRHIEDSLAAADRFDAKAMESIAAGDRVTADGHWDTASLLRVSAHMLRQLVSAGALSVL